MSTILKTSLIRPTLVWCKVNVRCERAWLLVVSRAANTRRLVTATKLTKSIASVGIYWRGKFPILRLVRGSHIPTTWCILVSQISHYPSFDIASNHSWVFVSTISLKNCWEDFVSRWFRYLAILRCQLDWLLETSSAASVLSVSTATTLDSPSWRARGVAVVVCNDKVVTARLFGPLRYRGQLRVMWILFSGKPHHPMHSQLVMCSWCYYYKNLII